MNLTAPLCDSCSHSESVGHSRCFKCGAPLSPTREAVEQIRAIYAFIRNLALPGMELSHATPLGGLYWTGGRPHYMPPVMVFIGPDWLGLNYFSRTANLAYVATVTQEWREELNLWRTHRPDQPIKLTAENFRRAHVCFLAGLEEQTGMLTLRRFQLGDWCGLINPVLRRTTSQ